MAQNFQYDENSYAFAKDIMLQARKSLENIVSRLEKSGYVFAYPKYVALPPPQNIRDQINELESIVGTMPLSIRTAFEYLGSWNLMGQHPDWPKSANIKLRPIKNENDIWFTDPFVFTTIETILEDTEGWDRIEKFPLTFSGDAMTKAAYSGGIYSILIPCVANDAPIIGANNQRLFIEYLQLSLNYGGFAGFEEIQEKPQVFLDQLTAP